LGLASGLIGHALNLDCADETIVPATTQSTFSFKFNPHPLIDCELIHQNGQVEIDAIFVEKRNNRDCLFLLEAKSGSETSIAKHKILYPVLALYNEVPHDMPIIPVYVKIQEQNDGIIYNIAECEISDPRKSKTYISDLIIKNSSSYYLPIPLKKK